MSLFVSNRVCMPHLMPHHLGLHTDVWAIHQKVDLDEYGVDFC